MGEIKKVKTRHFFSRTLPLKRLDTFSAPFFRYYLHIASYGTIFAAKWSSNGGSKDVVSKRLAQGHKGLTAHRCSFCFFFSANCVILCQ